MKLGCWYCEREPEPGWIETDNNGPIVSCPICNPDAPARSPNDDRARLADVARRFNVEDVR